MFSQPAPSGISSDELLALVRRDDPGAHFSDRTVNGCRVLVTTTLRPDRIRAIAPDLQIHTELDFFAGEPDTREAEDAYAEVFDDELEPGVLGAEVVDDRIVAVETVLP